MSRPSLFDELRQLAAEARAKPPPPPEPEPELPDVEWLAAYIIQRLRNRARAGCATMGLDWCYPNTAFQVTSDDEETWRKQRRRLNAALEVVRKNAGNLYIEGPTPEEFPGKRWDDPYTTPESHPDLDYWVQPDAGHYVYFGWSGTR